MKTKLILLLLIGVFITTSGFGCKISGEVQSFTPISLQYWGVYEEPDAMKLLIEPYQARHPKITIVYSKFTEEEYYDKMLRAWAQGQGPDLFMIPNTKIREQLPFLEPMPKQMRAPVTYEKGTIKKEQVTDMRSYEGLSLDELQKKFIDVVVSDVIVNNKIYALPYGIDMLSVFYNRDLLKASNLALPATNWNELIAQIPAITKVNKDKKLVQSAIALGTTNNVPAVFEIVSSIFMQLGITIASDKGPDFHTDERTLSAIDFYLGFAKEGLQSYSWSKDMPNALEAFASGKVAYFIGYPHHRTLIRGINQKINIEALPLFKPADAPEARAYASYWVTVVTKPPVDASPQRKQKAELAWQYLIEATDAKNVQPYLANQKNPHATALRSLVESQKKDPVLGPFAQDLIQAQSWYHGYDFVNAKKYFLEMIDNVAKASEEGVSPTNFITAGASRISQTYRAPQ